VTDQLPEGFDTDQFTETWGVKGRFGIVPLAGGRVYWFACINGPQNDACMRAYGPEELSKAFKDFHFPIPQLISNTPREAILWNDILDFKPIDKYVYDRIVLLGDAAHATTPNMGQGACQAIEGAVILGTYMLEASSPEEAFKAYEQAKVEKAQWVVNNSWQFGKIAQLDNPILVGLRNGLFRMIPAKSTEKRMKKLLTFST
jgi:2-polyprenyl-6-methoxyphenol hydroxylase-like FAD-dependent oxidoreductase